MRAFITRTFLPVAAAAALLTLSADFARADAIDGHWCRADGKRMHIQGPDIVIPGGRQIKGDYTRHSFSYVVPAGETGAGKTIAITLLSEYHAQSREGDDPAVHDWRRCQADVS